MPFPCPGCRAPVSGDPETWALRCASCGVVLRCRALDSDGPTRAYDVEVVGRPETRQRVLVPWDEDQRRRLGRWLLWSSVVTLGLVAILYALARLSS